MPKISRFDGKYRFLSNFWPGGSVTLEHKYQAAKAMTELDKAYVLDAASPGQAKRRGRQIQLRPDWEEIKVEVMLSLLRDKFIPGTREAQWLLDTGDLYLEEGNTWKDTFWGTYNGAGENHLGKLLMQVRIELREKSVIAT